MVLDPAGRASRVDPSQVTEVVDNSFGTGKSARIPKKTMRKITERIRDTLRMGEDDYSDDISGRPMYNKPYYSFQK